MEPFLGEIKMVGFNFAPIGWAMCNGQLLPISQNDALFALIGTIYGGDGQNTFGLPDLRSRVPVHFSNSFPIGAAFGNETTTLNSAQIPAHGHMIHAADVAADQSDPSGHFLGASATKTQGKTYGSAPDTTMAAQSVNAVGGSQPHENRQPYLAATFIIALEGIFPSQN